MDIISYRGPSCPGGVSGALSRIVERLGSKGYSWWCFAHNALILRQNNSAKYVCHVAKNVFEGHYRHCNNFIWPIMHGLPKYASFSETDRDCYHQFNLALAANVQHTRQDSPTTSYFVQDYQLALVPGLLRKFNSSSHLFWHIPWPNEVPEEFVPFIIEIAESLLSAGKIGFHIEEYARNFLDFVDLYMADYATDFPRSSVYKVIGASEEVQVCKIVVQPVGLDLQFWNEMLRRHTPNERRRIANSFVREPYILSVDRADYTKGVVERLQAIDSFFFRYPECRKDITFLQICQRTRHGLTAFDQYWLECQSLLRQINNRWAEKDWKPIVWIEEPVEPAVLAALYEHASMMLISPLRDGLNLTAKEFIACSLSNPAPLLLSRSVGAWDELGEHVLEVKSGDAVQTSEAIAGALALTVTESRRRAQAMHEVLESNTLQNWWHSFSGDITTPGGGFEHEARGRMEAEKIAFAI